MEEFEIDAKPARGGHPQWWMDLTPAERVAHYNRNLAYGCTHKASIFDWPPDLVMAYSFDPYAHVSHDDVHHSKEAFFARTCECNACVRNVGLEKGSPYEYNKRKKVS